MIRIDRGKERRKGVANRIGRVSIADMKGKNDNAATRGGTGVSHASDSLLTDGKAVAVAVAVAVVVVVEAGVGVEAEDLVGLQAVC